MAHGVCLYFDCMQHDSTVAAFLCAIGAFNGLSPQYTASVHVELFNSSGQFFVEVWYRNDTVHVYETFQMIVPGE